jgi:uncharacterized repeat protein (TIGR03803 family)
MRHRCSLVRFKGHAARVAAATIFLTALGVATASAVSYSIIYAFPGLPNGWAPVGPLVMDADGNLYGTTALGGVVVPFQPSGCGTVFELSPPSTSGGAWTELLLHAFQGGTDGCYAGGGVTADRNGNLYGTTVFDGQTTQCSGNGCGTVFELTPPAIAGGEWGYRVIYRFSGGPNEGSEPDQLVVDGKGAIYGTTRLGPTSSSSSGCGTVFELKPQGSRFVETTLHIFCASSHDGWDPAGGLTPDASGKLFGSTVFGGVNDFGTVYALTPPGSPEGAWSESILHSFPTIYNFFNWGIGTASRIINKNGDLFGTTVYEGSACGYGCGTVFRLTQPDQLDGRWTISILYDFSNVGDGSGPNALYLDPTTSSLYGTNGFTNYNSAGCGVFFQLAPPTTKNGPWNYGILHTFMGLNDGCVPDGNLVRDSSGNYYGVTGSGGMPNGNNGSGFGTVFEVTP